MVHLSIRTTLAAITIGLTLLIGANRTNAASTTLYDGVVDGTPDTQSWLAFGTLPSPYPQATQTTISGGTRLNTGVTNFFFSDSNLTIGGYSNYNSCLSACTPTLVNGSFPTLERNVGYTLRIDVIINSESHVDNDRSGFSIIAISSDGTKGIELDFFSNEIWAQNDDTTPPSSGTIFTHGEGTSFDTTTSVTRYDLSIQGDNYALYVNGSQTPILIGPLRNYSAFDYTHAGPNGSSLPYNPYTTPNFVSFGDNSSRGQVNADITFAQISVNDPPASFKSSPSLRLLALEDRLK